MLWKLSAGIHHISVGHISENVSNISVMLPTRFPSTKAGAWVMEPVFSAVVSAHCLVLSALCSLPCPVLKIRLDWCIIEDRGSDLWFPGPWFAAHRYPVPKIMFP